MIHDENIKKQALNGFAFGRSKVVVGALVLAQFRAMLHARFLLEAITPPSCCNLTACCFLADCVMPRKRPGPAAP